MEAGEYVSGRGARSPSQAGRPRDGRRQGRRLSKGFFPPAWNVWRHRIPTRHWSAARWREKPGPSGHLVDRYKDAVYGTAYAHVGDFHEAQDLSQEAFILAYRRLRSLRVPERFPNWLHAIVRNLCHDHVRARREARTLEEARPADPCDPAEEHSRRAVHRHVRRAVASLFEPHREAVSLYYIDGYTCDQVAGFLGVTEGTVKRRLHEARNRLRKEMIHMVRDLFQDNRLPPSFRRVVV